MAAAALTVTVAFAAPSKTVKLAFPKGDVTGALDLQRASLNLGSDGRLRAVITLVGKASPSAMLAETGPPGSVSLEDTGPTRTPNPPPRAPTGWSA